MPASGREMTVGAPSPEAPAPGRRERSLAAILVGGGIWALGGKCVGGVLGLVITATLARLMPPAELGVYLLAFSFVSIVATLARLGLEQVGLRLVAESLGRGDSATAAAVAWRALALVAAAAVAVGLLAGALLGPWLARGAFGSAALAEAMPAAGAWLACFAIQLTLAELFRGCRDIRLASLFGGTVFGGALSTMLLAAAVGGAWALGLALSAREALWVSAAVTAATAALGLALLARRLPPRRSPATRGPGWGALARLGLPLLVSQLGVLVMVQADIWILGLFRPEDEVALYGAAARLVRFLALLAIVNDVTAPEIARLNVHGQRERLETLLQTTATLAALPCLAALAVVALAPGEILALLFGPFYRDSAPVLVILAMGVATVAFVGSAPYVLMMTGHGAVRMGVSLGGTAAMLAGGFLLTPAFGPTGLAVAVAGALALQQVAAWLCVRRYCGVWTHADPVKALGQLRRFLGKRASSSHAA